MHGIIYDREDEIIHPRLYNNAYNSFQFFQTLTYYDSSKRDDI